MYSAACGEAFKTDVTNAILSVDGFEIPNVYATSIGCGTYLVILVVSTIYMKEY